MSHTSPAPVMTMEEAVPPGKTAGTNGTRLATEPGPARAASTPGAADEPSSPTEAISNADGTASASQEPHPAILAALNAPTGAVYFSALVSEALLGLPVALLDARELQTSQLRQIGPHNRVFLAGRERIVCGVPNEDAGPIPLPPMLVPGALSNNLLVLQDTYPDLLISLRSGAWETPGDPASRTPGWLAELSLASAQGRIVAAGFHPVPEAALFYAALQMALTGPHAERVASAAARVEALFDGATPPNPYAMH